MNLGTQRDHSIPKCFAEAVEVDDCGFRRRNESTQVVGSCPIPGGDELVNVHVELGARHLGLQPITTKQLEKVGGLRQVRLPRTGSSSGPRPPSSTVVLIAASSRRPTRNPPPPTRHRRVALSIAATAADSPGRPTPLA